MKWETKLKRLLSVTLILSMIMSVVQVISFAGATDGTEDGIIEEMQDEGGEFEAPGEYGGYVTPDPGDGNTTPDPDSGDVTPDPDDGNTTPDPDSGNVTPDPDDGNTTPDPDSGNVTPDAGTENTAPDADNGNDTPSVGGEDMTPAGPMMPVPPVPDSNAGTTTTQQNSTAAVNGGDDVPFGVAEGGNTVSGGASGQYISSWTVTYENGQIVLYLEGTANQYYTGINIVLCNGKLEQIGNGCLVYQGSWSYVSYSNLPATENVTMDPSTLAFTATLTIPRSVDTFAFKFADTTVLYENGLVTDEIKNPGTDETQPGGGGGETQPGDSGTTSNQPIDATLDADVNNPFQFGIYANVYENGTNGTQNPKDAYHIEGNVAAGSFNAASVAFYGGKSYLGDVGHIAEYYAGSSQVGFQFDKRQNAIAIARYNASNQSTNSYDSGSGYFAIQKGGVTLKSWKNSDWHMNNRLESFEIVDTDIKGAIKTGIEVKATDVSNAWYNYAEMPAGKIGNVWVVTDSSTMGGDDLINKMNDKSCAILVMNISASKVQDCFNAGLAKVADYGIPVVINIKETTVDLGWMNPNGVSGGLGFADWPQQVLVNCGKATSVTVPSGGGTILAPKAKVSYSNGNIVGAVIADVVYQGSGGGCAEIHQKNWCMYTPVFGSLEISKTVTGTGGDQTKYFTFTVKLTNSEGTPLAYKTITTSKGSITLDGSGQYTFTLKHGESLTIRDLPVGVKYTVEETKEDDYQVSINGEAVADDDPARDEGVIAAGGSTSAFGNHRDEGDLVVKKTVTGEGGDKTKDFTFTVTLNPALTGTYGDMTFVNGVATFTLKHGESKTADGFTLKDGESITYTVVETDNEGYEVTSTGATGTIKKDEPATAAFTNHKDAGSLTVNKTVVPAMGEQIDTSKEFEFTVTLNPALTGTYGGMTFENGVATFTLKHGESLTATGIPFGTRYVVTETADREYETKWTGGTGTITEDEAIATAVCTNTKKPDVGNLKVIKTVAGKDGDTNKDFSFTVTLSDTTINGTYGDMTFVSGVATFTLKHNQTKTATDLPTGVTYTVTETTYDGYTTTWVGNTGAITKDVTAEVTCTNTRNTGDLKVTKVVAGKDGDTNKDFSFTVTLSDKSINGTYGEMEFKDGEATFTLKHNQTKTATDLPTGVTYTVTETTYDGYTTTWEGETGAITKDVTAEVTCTNTRNTGDLKVTKVVNGWDTSGTFNFVVTLSDKSINGNYGEMEFKDGVATFTLKHNQTKTATGLPTGITYEVKEIVPQGANYAPTWEGNTGTITKGETAATATCTNTRDTGSLTISKTVVDASGRIDTEKEFEFTVKLTKADNTPFTGELKSATGDTITFDEDGQYTFTLKHNESLTIMGIPTGFHYSVVEKDYTDDGYTTKWEGKVEGDIIKDEIAVTCTNTRDTGSLTVSKSVSGKGGDKDKDFTFTVALYDADDKPVSGEFKSATGDTITFDEDGQYTFTLKDGESITIEGIPTGFHYSVEEEDYTEDGYKTSYTGGQSGTIEKDSEVSVVCTNKLPDGTGELIVKKVVAGTGGDENKDFTFTVTLYDADEKPVSGKFEAAKTPSGDSDEDEVEFINGVTSFTLKHGESMSIKGLPVGATYKVVESDNDGYTVSVTEGEAEGTISADELAEAVFTNTRDTGDLIVSKTVVGDDADFTKEFTFTVTLTDSSITGTFNITRVSGSEGAEEETGNIQFTDGKAEFTLKHGESLTISGLPTGIGYTIAETSYSGYTVTSTGETGSIAKNNSATAEFVNTYRTGSLTISKAVTGRGADLGKEFVFTVALNDTTINGRYGDMDFVNGKAIVRLKDGESATATKLPAGVGYSVGETVDSDYVMTSEGSTNSTIPANGTAIVAFTNTYKTGSLTVSKTVAEGGNPNVEFTFNVVLSDNTINGRYGDMDFVNGVAEITLKHGESKTASELPNGVTYFIGEIRVITGYSLVDSSGTSGKILTGSTAIAAFVNDLTPPPPPPYTPTYTPNTPNTPNTPYTPNTPSTPNTPYIPTPAPNTPNTPNTPNLPESTIDVPNYPTPLADESMNIDDIVVPLDLMTTEEEEDLFDLDFDVPLDNFIPLTGDGSIIWLITAAVSAIGLIVLYRADKKREDEV